MKDLDDYDRLVGMFYEASLESGRREEPLNELLRQIDGSGFHFLGWDPKLNMSPFAAISSSWSHFFDGYHTEYGKIDPHLSAGVADPVGHWLVSHQRFDKRFVSRNQYYQEFLIPGGVRHLMGTSLVRGAGIDVVVGVGRAVGTDPFSEVNIALVRRITPHTQRAVRLHMRTTDLRLQARIGEVGLNAMDSGVVAADKNGRVVFANQFAEMMLTAGNCIKVICGQLRAAVSQDDTGLQSAICLASASRSAQTVRLRNLTGQATDGCSATIVPLAQDNRMGVAFHRPEVLVLVSSPKQRHVPGARDFMELFGLTAAEARLAEGLASGLDLKECASRGAVSKETVRAQLKSVFAKAGVRRQADLVRLLGDVAVAHGQQTAANRSDLP